jgi:hypothetical protein
MKQYKGVLLIPSISISANTPGGRADFNFFDVIIKKLDFLLNHCKNNSLRPVFTGRLTTQKLSLSTLNKLLLFLKGSDAVIYDEHIFLKSMLMDENNITGVLINAGVLSSPSTKDAMSGYFLTESIYACLHEDNSIMILNGHGARVKVNREITVDGGFFTDSEINMGVVTRTLFYQQHFTPSAWEISNNLDVSKITPPYNMEVFFDAKVISDEGKRLASSSGFASQLKEAIADTSNSPSIVSEIEKTMIAMECRPEVMERIHGLIDAELISEEQDSEFF